MAAFIPFISEILPMIMPASPRIVRASDVQQPGKDAQPKPLPAMIDTCDKMCASGRLAFYGSHMSRLAVLTRVA